MTTTAPLPSTDGRSAADRSRHALGFWLVATLFVVVMAFSTVPTPLWSIYRADEGVSTLQVTMAFASYAVGVVLSLFLAGHVSDWVGRRRILLPALLLEVVAAVLFLTWVDLPGLLVARLANGLGVGLITATATAHLADLHAAARPDAGPRRAGIVATAANLGGLGLGSLVAGVLAQVAPAPLRTSYVVFLVLLVVVTVALLAVPETVTPPAEKVAYRPQRVAVPAEARVTYAGAAIAGFAAFMVCGLFTSLAPSLLASIGWRSPVVAGAAAFMVFTAAALAQMVMGHLAPAAQLRTGLALTAVGVVVLGVGVLVSVAAVFLVGGLVAGAGGGLLLKGALGTAVGLTTAERRGEATAGIFLAAYLGLTVPVLGIGLATAAGVGLEAAVASFAIATLVVLAVATTTLRRAATR